MADPILAEGTVAHVFRNSGAADDAVRRLRAAGFADVRISERTGETSQAHVAPEDGLTQIDFEESLRSAGFTAGEAQALASGVARGGALVTIAAAERAHDAAAVLRGESVAAPVLHPAAASSIMAPGPIDPDSRVVQLRGEQLDVSTVPERSEARVRREVVTEQRTITVPVRHEELVIERDGAETVRIPLDERGDPAGPA